MVATIKIGDSNVTYVVGASPRRYLVEQATLIDTAIGYAIRETNLWADNIFEIRGTVHQSQIGFSALGLYGDRSDVLITKSGSINGNVGVSLQGVDQRLVNSGSIVSTVSVGVDAGQDSVRIVNHGSIYGWSRAISLHDGAVPVVINDGDLSGRNGIVYEQDATRIVNRESGVISVTEIGIRNISVAGQASELINHGLIRAGTGQAMSFGAGVERVLNDGVLRGEILLGDGNDVFDNRGGKINGVVTGGPGNDTMITDLDTDRLLENDGDGKDTVKSTIGYSLPVHVERLFLLGHSAIDGLGNASDNRMVGNRGNNHLLGLVGDDRLDGGRGNDRLLGASGADTFVFAAHGDADTADFIGHVDFVDLTGLPAIADMKDLKSHHLTIDGPDVIIHAGGDSLTLLDTNIAELKAPYFFFA